ncbi:MAG TPA: TIGR00374 family protein, partial [Solirubrobacteraceae bacterium]
MLASSSRTLRNSIISLAIFFALVVAMLFAIPGLRAAGEQIADAHLPWVGAAITLEVLSCAGYVVLFELVFGRLGRSLTSRLSLAELAVNSVVSVSGLAGIALGAWVLRSKGLSVERIAKRSVLIFVLTSAVNVVAVLLIGVPMWLGLLPGSQNALLTLLPAAAALAMIVGVLVLASWARREGAVRHMETGRWAVALRAVGGGVEEA